jgi:inosine/xanthosine triphosphatase
MRIGIGSNNPAKIKAAEPFLNYFKGAQLTIYPSPSLVSDQPFSDEETKCGALNRAHDCAAKGADIGMGFEGGVMEMKDGLYLCNWGAVADQAGNSITASGARILLPPAVEEGLRSGVELGVWMGEWTQDPELRKKEGAIGVFTSGLLSRSEMFIHISTILLGQYLYRLKK